jgi:phosphoribosylaminoimidazolecarboxamide formyltransferase / IMP cyclohydrolase
MEMALRYGCNPHQTPARLLMPGDAAPLSVLNGRPGYINMLDALGAWQLVHELQQATGLPSAASFKHTSPAGAAVARPLTETFRQAYLLPDIELSPVATAYARARGGGLLVKRGQLTRPSFGVSRMFGASRSGSLPMAEGPRCPQAQSLALGMNQL